jgi:hypothetical protein
MHRFVWDLHYPPPATDTFSFPIAAVPGDTPRRPSGPWVLPGRYTVTLVAGGVRTSQPLVIRMDPRVETPRHGLEEQFKLSMQVIDAIARVHGALAPPTGTTGTTSAADALEPIRQLHGDLLLAYEALQEVDVAPAAAVGLTVRDLLKLVDACCRE